MGKRVYCHTTYNANRYDDLGYKKDDPVDLNHNSSFLKDYWYDINYERDAYYVIQQCDQKFIGKLPGFGNLVHFYKKGGPEKEWRLFSDYFYTEQEYNRYINLNKLLNE